MAASDYEPSPRHGAISAAVKGELYLHGGRTKDFKVSELLSNVEVFNQYLEDWRQHKTVGPAPPGLYGGASASSEDLVYHYGGFDDSSLFDCLHVLKTKDLQWTELKVSNIASYSRTP